MMPKDMPALKKWFDHYVSEFYTNDPDYNHAIQLKQAHTERVCENMMQLAQDLPPRKKTVAECIALFHDLGRFKQYAIYNTFNDGISENHALLGIRELALSKILAAYPLKERRWIFRAIAFHNSPSLPVKEKDADGLLFIKMIRDADKLDIWKVFADHYKNREFTNNRIIELGLPNKPFCSSGALQAFDESRIVFRGDLNTLNDLKLLQLSWVFDLNFQESFRMAVQRDDLSCIVQSLPQMPGVAQAVKKAWQRVETAIKGAKNDGNTYVADFFGRVGVDAGLYSAENRNFHLNEGCLSGGRQEKEKI